MRYMCVTFLTKPNGQIDEQVYFSKRVKPKELSTCNIVLDFFNKKIDKCYVDGKVLDADWDRMLNYYKQIYPNEINQLEQANTIVPVQADQSVKT